MLWYRGMIGNDIDGGWGMMWIGFCKILSLAPIGRAAEPLPLGNGAIAEPWKAGKNCIHAIFTREFSCENSPIFIAKK